MSCCEHVHPPSLQCARGSRDQKFYDVLAVRSSDDFLPCLKQGDDGQILQRIEESHELLLNAVKTLRFFLQLASVIVSVNTTTD